jgi:hypothetical protein
VASAAFIENLTTTEEEKKEKKIKLMEKEFWDHLVNVVSEKKYKVWGVQRTFGFKSCMK